MREVVPTQSALLELREEREGMQEGYRFLDEKRLVLAAEIVRELQSYEETRTRFHQLFATSVSILQLAIGRHGLQGLGIYPVGGVWSDGLSVSERSVLGVLVQSARMESPEPKVVQTGYASPEAEQCRAGFAALVPAAARLSAISGNLQRLRDEYRQTARRARALEDVLIPEIDEILGGLELALDDLDREEAIRVRHGQRTDGG